MRTMAWKLLAVLFALSIGGTAQAGPGDPLGAPFVVGNTNHWGPPEVVRDAAGNFLVSWGVYPSLRARLYYADGTPQGPEFTLVSPQGEYFVGGTQVGMSATGDFAVAWSEYITAARKTQIFVRTFHADGTPRTPIQTVASYTQREGGFDLSMNADGHFVVVWNDVYQVYGPPLGENVPLYSVGTTRILAKRYDLDGNTDKGNILVGTSVLSPSPIYGYGPGTAARPAVDPHGGFIVIWQDRNLAGKGVLYQRRYKADGKADGLKTQVGEPEPASSRQASIVMDQAGNYLISWIVRRTPGVDSKTGFVQLAQRYSALGTATGSQFRFDTGPNDWDSLTVRMDPDGDAVIAWLGLPVEECCVAREVYLQTYAPDNSPKSGRVVVREEQYLNNSAVPTMNLDGYGNPVVLWEENAQVMGRLYQAR